MKIIFQKIVFCLTIVLILSPVIFCNETFATDINNSIADKALYQGIYTCYTKGYVKTKIDKLSSYSTSPNGWGDLGYITTGMDNNSPDNTVVFVTGWKGREIDVHDDYGLPCYQFFNGFAGTVWSGSAHGLMIAFGKTAPQATDTNGIIGLTKNLGYEISTNSSEDTSSEESCFNLKYTDKQTKPKQYEKSYTMNQVCMDQDSNLYADEVSAAWSDAPASFEASGDQVCLFLPNKFGFRTKKGCNSLGSSKFSGEWLLSSVNNICGSIQCKYGWAASSSQITGTSETDGILTFDSSESKINETTSSLDKTSASFINNDAAIAATTAIKYFSGSISKHKDILVTDLEKRLLYQAYLTTYYNVEINCESGLSDSAFDGKLNWLDSDNKIKECHYETNNAENKDKKVNGIDENGYFIFRSLSLDDLIEAIKQLPTEYPEDQIESLVDKSNDGNENGKVERTCMNSGGAGSLGWIVCSVLDWMGDATEGLYNNIVEPALVVNASFFDQDATREAWEKFRDIANIIFIIVVLAVIFSQLTGYGIDNYGIKKILPKLIVVAILVNLSFLICVLCVDLSNILGNGLQAFLDGLATGADTISISGGPSWGDSGSVNIAADAGIVSVAVIAAAVGVYAVYSNPAILLTLLIGALGVLIAVLFVFIMLAGRKAAVVLLTVLSPVAFILCLLPNTKKIYDKWLKLWEAMLFLYPICGLLIGGGNFASKLMLNVGKDGGVATVLTALVIGIIPIFFVPTLLKSAFAAMGNIGSTISGFGNRMRSGATRGLKNSGAYKELQERGKESGIRRKAGYDKNGNRKWGENGPNWRQRFLRGGNRNIQRNAMAYQKLQSEKGALAATEGANYMLATETANEAKRIASSGEINTIGSIGSGGLTDGLYRALMSGDRAKINAYSDALSAKGENGRKAVKDAYNRAVADGVNDVAAKTLADNIMANHAADYKNNNRSMFNVAQGINSGEKDAVMSTSSYVDAHQSELANKVTAATIGTMDEDAFDETFGIRDANGEIKYGVPTGADAATIGEIAYKAMSTQNAGIKSDRMAKLKGVMEASGYSGPGIQDVNVTNMPKTVAAPGAAEEGKTFDVRAMSDETLLDMATNPNVANDDPTRTAAEQEYLRRNNGKV